MVNYSIIIPHKNSYALLLKLLKTIPNLPEFEVIVVDDCSESEQIDKLKSNIFATNVKVIYQSIARGAGAARNKGIEVAKGKWLIFADSDDYFSGDMNIIVDEYRNSDADIVYFLCDSVNTVNGERAERHSLYNFYVENFSSKDGEDLLRYKYTPPWGKMIRRDIVLQNSILFDEVKTSNDVFFSIKVAYYARIVDVSKKVLYNITVTSGSLITKMDKEAVDSRYLVALRSNLFLRQIKKHKYQQSILYYCYKAPSFGLKYFLRFVALAVKYRANPFIGLSKLSSLRRVLSIRESKF